jgi:hypothetical protein
VERNGSEATLIVDSPRPVDSAAITIAQEFGIRVAAGLRLYQHAREICSATPFQ